MFAENDEYANSMFTYFGLISAETLPLIILISLTFPALMAVIILFPDSTYAPMVPAALIGLAGPPQIVSMFLDDFNNLQNQLVSVRRILDYHSLKSEEKLANEKEPTKDPDQLILGEWPHKGRVEFRSVSLKYEKGEDYALKGVSFEASPTSKIGIVGRTGAGKSSILQALFRLTKIE